MPTSDRFVRVTANVEAIKEELERAAMAGASPAIVKRKFRTLVHLVGTRATKRVITDLQDALSRAGVFANPPIDGTVPSLDTWIELSLEPTSEELALFAREKDLVAFVEHTLGVGVFRGLVPFTHGGTGSGREHILPDKRRIDLLCEERSFRGKRALVAIELKRAHDHGAVAQMVGYLKALRRQLPEREVRGIIVAGRTNETARELLRAVTEFRIDLVVYEVRFETVAASMA
jgi:hypothetical protein